MRIETIRIADYSPAAYNPRKDLQPDDAEYRQLEKSIEEFGFLEPLVVNIRTRRIISGHQRLKILLARGEESTQAVVVDFDESKEKAANLALNKIKGDWDKEKLAHLLDELSQIPDFDVQITGFDEGEISSLLDRYVRGDSSEDIDSADLLPDEPVTQRGDLIELGPHRILCGDSASPDDIKRLVGEFKVDMVHTDPPYNVDYYGGKRPHDDGRPKNCKQWERIYFDNLPQEEYEKWLRQVFENMATVVSDKAPVYIWNGHRQFGPMHRMLTEMGFFVSCVIAWVKERFAIGYGDYNQQSEFCLYGWKDGEGGHPWYGPENESTVWEVSRDDTKTYIHPTQKPLKLPLRAIRNSSKTGDLVLDLFLGSGSTLIAAQELNRRCFGMELDPKYCDGIVRRYLTRFGTEGVSEDIVKKYGGQI
jgi:DNA modification methylase